jgi:DNA-binding response OmpR family regulator
MNNRSILVVDDDAVIRLAYSKMFITAGYDVRTAGSAEEALQIMGESPAAILFLDLGLPAMNGVDLCRKVRQEWPCTILIAVTGYASIFELVKCREVGFEDYFCKPAGPKELLPAADAAVKKLERWKQRDATPRARAKSHPPLDKTVKKVKGSVKALEK